MSTSSYPCTQVPVFVPACSSLAIFLSLGDGAGSPDCSCPRQPSIMVEVMVAVSEASTDIINRTGPALTTLEMPSSLEKAF